MSKIFVNCNRRSQSPKIWLFSFILISLWSVVWGQPKRKQINIERANDLVYSNKIIQNAQRLIGDVYITHNDIQMWCDSAYSYTDKNAVDGFGHVHILKGDTLHLYADFVAYNGDTKQSKARRNVRMINRDVILTTDSLDYDMNINVGYYKYHGTIKDTANVLVSQIGQYFVNTEKAYFKDSVKVTTKDYTILSDTLIYNTRTRQAFLAGPSRILNEKDTLYAEAGMYDTQKEYARLIKRPRISNKNQWMKADSIFYDKISGNGLALGHAHLEDLKNKSIVRGNRVEYNEKTEIALAVDSAVFITYSDKDSLYLHSDTLKMVPDTTLKDAKLVRAYYNVRFFRADIQGKCDSLAYFSKDSTLQMFNQPVIWSENNQISGDYIEMISKKEKSGIIHMKNNAFIIAMEEDSLGYNQIKGKNMTGYIRNNELYKVDVDGNGESVYYARDKDGVIGLNKAESSYIRIFLKEGKVQKISFIDSTDGQLSPLEQIDETEKTLQGFNWQYDIRPKNKDDIFRH
jgi:lipopolysaccharide export system protein LptA